MYILSYHVISKNIPQYRSMYSRYTITLEMCILQIRCMLSRGQQPWAPRSKVEVFVGPVMLVALNAPRWVLWLPSNQLLKLVIGWLLVSFAGCFFEKKVSL